MVAVLSLGHFLDLVTTNKIHKLMAKAIDTDDRLVSTVPTCLNVGKRLVELLIAGLRASELLVDKVFVNKLLIGRFHVGESLIDKMRARLHEVTWVSMLHEKPDLGAVDCGHVLVAHRAD